MNDKNIEYYELRKELVGDRALANDKDYSEEEMQGSDKAVKTMVEDLKNYGITTRKDLKNYDEEIDYRKIILMIDIEGNWNGVCGRRARRKSHRREGAAKTA